MKILYVNFNTNNPRDQITLRGFKENGISVKEITNNTPGWRKYAYIAKELRATQDEYDYVFVGYAGSVLVIFLWFVTAKKIIYNALATFYDSMIVSRANGKMLSVKSIWFYLVDFFAFRLAEHSFLECQAQKDLVVRVFKLQPEKIWIGFVGTDDKQFFYDSNVPKLKEFTVVFRGAFLPEAGADVVVRAAKEIEKENIKVRILGRGLLKKEIEKLIEELKPINVELITEILPFETLRQKMLECHISLGQLADHPRVHTTIPHKIFESLSMKLPYLTGENRGVMEIVKDSETCFVVPPGDYHALARKIVALRNRPEELQKVAEKGYRLYQDQYTPKILAQKIVEKLQQHF